MTNILKNVSLKPYNTFGYRCQSKHFCEVKSTGELIELVQSDLFQSEQRLILGGGRQRALHQRF